MSSTKYRVRFKFKLNKCILLKKHSHNFLVAGTDISLTAANPNALICDSEWLVATAAGFENSKEAQDFGEKLKTAIDFSSVQCRLGVDSGLDRAPSGLFDGFRTELERAQHIVIRNEVHGIDVFVDNPQTKFASFSGTAKITAGPDAFLNEIDVLFATAVNSSQKCKNIITLMNHALLNPDPVAQIVFSISAVEMVGQTADWSETQKDLLNYLAQEACNSKFGSESERKEISDAIKHSLFKLSLRQGVMNLLKTLNLLHLKKNWDEIYSKRSSLVHGSAPSKDANYSELAHQTISLCGHILLQVVALDIPTASKLVTKYYPTATKA